MFIINSNGGSVEEVGQPFPGLRELVGKRRVLGDPEYPVRECRYPASGSTSIGRPQTGR